MQRVKNWINLKFQSFRDRLSPNQDTEFRSSLALKIVSLILLLSLLPTILWIISNYYRNRQLLYDQTTSQMQVFVTNQNNQLRQLHENIKNSLTELTEQPLFKTALEQFLLNPDDVVAQTSLRLQMNVYRDPNINKEATIDQFFVLTPDGKIKVATKDTWNGLDAANIPEIKSLFGTKGSYATYDPQPLYSNRFVVFTTHTYQKDDGTPQATIVATSTSSLPQYVLASSSSFLPATNAFYLTDNNSLLRIHPAGNEIIRIPQNTTYSDTLRSVIQNHPSGSAKIMSSLSGQSALTYVQRQPDIKTTLVLEVPTDVVYAQSNPFSGLTIFVLIAALAIIGISVSFLSSQVIRPILDLVAHSRGYAKGDWSQRLTVKRKDEIGLLGHTLNQMGDQLSTMYGSLEAQVNERTLQVRLAYEIAQMATSSGIREQIAERTVSLLVERFGYIEASIFLIDESGSSLILQAESRQFAIEPSSIGTRIRINTDTLVGWVAVNNQARVITNLDSELFTQNHMLDEATSEAAIPITVGNQILGILNVQSRDVTAFDHDTIIVLQTLANQIASGIQNIRLLESAQINLEETTLLYRSSRQITQAKQEDEVLEIITKTLQETPYITGLYSVENDHIRIVSIHDPKEQHSKSGGQGITLPLQHIANTLHTGEMLFLTDLAERADLQNIISFYIRRGCLSAALFPIHVDGNLSKIIVLASRDQGALIQNNLQPFSNLVEVASTILSRFTLLDSLEVSVNEFQILASVSQAISAETNIDNLFPMIHEQIKQIIGSDIGFMIASYNPKTNFIEIPFLFENDEILTIDPFELGKGLTSIIIQSQKPLLINKDTEKITSELGAKIIGKPAKSWLGIPLLVGGNVIGAIVLQDLINEERFTDSQYQLLLSLAPQLAVSLRNAQLITEMTRTLNDYDQERFLLNTLLLNIPDQIYFKDAFNQYLRVSNSYAQRFIGGNQNDFQGKIDIEIFGDEIGSRLQQEDLEVLESSLPKLGVIERATDINGSDIWTISNRIPMTNENGQVAGILGITHDITGLKQAEELSQKIAQQLRTAAEIARDTSGTLNLDELMFKAVNLIRDRFGFYHSSIFLIEEKGEFAVIKESTGEAGNALKLAEHKLQIGSRSLVGQATYSGEIQIINNVHENPEYFANPLLPETNSECVIPLKIGDKVLGILDVQSIEKNAFLAEDVDILRILADQLTIAVSNANLYNASQEMLEQHRLIHQITSDAAKASNTAEALLITTQGLHSANVGQRIAIYLVTDQHSLELKISAGFAGNSSLGSMIPFGSGVQGHVALYREPILIQNSNDNHGYGVPDNETRSQLSIPIIYRDSLLGVLDLQSDQISFFDEYDQQLMTTLTNSLATIIYNTQLINQIQRQVERQQMVYEISSRIRRSVDIENILQTSASEICKALGARRTNVAIQTESPILTQSTGTDKSSPHPSVKPIISPVAGIAEKGEVE